MAANVLSARDTNAQLQPSPSPEKKSDKAQSLEHHRQALQSRIKEEPSQQYVSPSDEIMSPATQKLQAFRNKHVATKARPQTLFKKSSARKVEAAKGGAMFGDITPKHDANEGSEQEKEAST